MKMHYVSAGDSGKPLMLLLHGFPEFWYSWRHQIKEFKKKYRYNSDLSGVSAGGSKVLVREPVEF